MLGGNIAAVVFGLASALSWGAGDFSGGLATKRAPCSASWRLAMRPGCCC